MFARELDQPRPSRFGQRATARILERRDRVEEGRWIGAAAELGGERVRVETFVVHRQGHDLDPLTCEHLERAVVARSLDQDAPRPARKLLGGVEDESLEAADGEDDLPGRHAMTLRDPLAQRGIASARAVGEHPGAVATSNLVRAVGKLVGGDEIGSGSAASERDRRGGHADEPTRRRCRRRRTEARSNRGGARRSGPL